MELICEAIRRRALIEFDYDGQRRVVQPYVHGTSATRREVLRGVQVGGASRSGGFGFGKLWLVEKMRRLRISDERLRDPQRDYNPDDSAMIAIHCRI